MSWIFPLSQWGEVMSGEPGLLTFSVDPQESLLKHLSQKYIMPTVSHLLFSGLTPFTANHLESNLNIAF